LRRRASLSLLLLVALPLVSCRAPAGRDPEVAAIEQACLDFAEGYYGSDATRMRRAAHPELVHRTVRANKLTTTTLDDVVLYSTMEHRKKPAIAVEVLDVYARGGIATARITTDYFDYAQLAKIDGKWRIVNVLWATHRE